MLPFHKGQKWVNIFTNRSGQPDRFFPVFFFYYFPKGHLKTSILVHTGCPKDVYIVSYICGLFGGNGYLPVIGGKDSVWYNYDLWIERAKRKSSLIVDVSWADCSSYYMAPEPKCPSWKSGQLYSCTVGPWSPTAKCPLFSRQRDERRTTAPLKVIKVSIPRLTKTFQLSGSFKPSDKIWSEKLGPSFFQSIIPEWWVGGGVLRTNNKWTHIEKAVGLLAVAF